MSVAVTDAMRDAPQALRNTLSLLAALSPRELTLLHASVVADLQGGVDACTASGESVRDVANGAFHECLNEMAGKEDSERQCVLEEGYNFRALSMILPRLIEADWAMSNTQSGLGVAFERSRDTWTSWF